jgi:outer membrane protein assembly factor BamB
MRITKSKLSTIITVFLLLTVIGGTSVLTLPTDAHTPAWTIVSYAYLSVAPDPVGVGQTVAIVMWVDAPLPSATVTNDIRRTGYTLTITKPDGKTDTQSWPVVSDTTSIQYFQYTPDQLGTYNLKFDYAGQTYTWSGTYQNDIILPASKSSNFTVQQDPIAMPIDSYPMPTEYWMRPIEGQNTYWYSIASNWLGAPYIVGANPSYGVPGAYQPNGAAPDTPHVMWAKPIQFGGVVGGDNTTVPGEMYYQGGSYNVRWNNPLIIQGTLFYPEPYGNSGTGGDYVAVDLQTGKELWRINTTATGTNLVPSFGYLYAFESPNQHGVLPNGALIATSGSTWRAYDPRTGYLTNMNITNVPGGTNVAGPRGEYLKLVLSNLGTSSNPNYYLMEWNSSRVFGAIAGTGVGAWYTGTANASLPSAYDWNVSVSLTGTGWSIGSGALGQVPLVALGNMALLIQGSFGGHPGDFSATVTTNSANITAISLNTNSIGQVLWTKTYDPAPGNNTRNLSAWDPSGGVFTFDDKETMAHWGYSLADGSYMWGPSYTPSDTTNDWNFLALGQTLAAYGKIYWTGYSGILYCFDENDGSLLWTYGNGGEGNSTSSGFTTPYGRYPLFISVIADGKVYVDSTEHSPNSPIYKGEQMRCINATTGEEIWVMFDDGNQMYGGVAPVADGYLAYLNTYDCRIYTVGKGPSQLTVNAPDLAANAGQSVVIRGTVTDIAAGTRQDEQAARFPNGVPCVSDESMSAWMEYVYMQKPRPTDATGVPVTINVVDANGNYREIGTATSDANGFYSLQWTPDIPGKYTVIASFTGTAGYWPSNAETAFAVDPAAATPTPTEQPVQSMSDMYFMPAVAGIIASIFIVGAILAILVLRKRP